MKIISAESEVAQALISYSNSVLDALDIVTTTRAHVDLSRIPIPTYRIN